MESLEVLHGVGVCLLDEVVVLQVQVGLLRRIQGHERVGAFGASRLEGLLELRLRSALRIIHRQREDVAHCPLEDVTPKGRRGGFCLMPGRAGDSCDVEVVALELREVGNDPLLVGAGDGTAGESVVVSNACR